MRLLLTFVGLSLGAFSFAADNLPEQLRSARSSLQPRDAEVVRAAKSRLVAAAKPVAEMLQGSEHGRAWKQFLDWPRLEGQLAPNAAPHVADLEFVLRQASTNHKSLEWPMYVELRAALRWYTRVARDAANPQAPTEFAQHLDDLARCLEQFDRQPTDELAAEIAGHCGWLDDGHHVPQLVAAARERVIRPNVLLQVSRTVIETIGRQKVDMDKRIADSVSGASVTGTSHTQGDLSFRVSPHESQIMLEAHFQGTTVSQTVAVRGPVTVNSQGQSKIASRMPIGFQRDGFQLYAAETTADGGTNVTGVQGRAILGGLVSEQTVTNRAWAEINASKERHNRESNQKTVTKFNKWMTDEFNARLKPLHDAYLDRLRHPLVRTDLWPERLDLRTTSDGVFFAAAIHAPQQAAAWSAPPTVEGSPLILVRVHQSAVENVGDKLLAGATLSRKQATEIWRTLLGQNADATADLDSGLRLDERDPLTVAFASDVFRVTLRGRKIVAGKATAEPLELTLRYRVEGQADGLTLTPLEIPEFLGSATDSEPIRFGDWAAKLGDGPLAKSLAQQIRGASLSAALRDGWLVLAWSEAATR